MLRINLRITLLTLFTCFLVFAVQGQVTPCSALNSGCPTYNCSLVCNPELCNGSSQGNVLSMLTIAGWGPAAGTPDCYPGNNFARYPFQQGTWEVSGWSHARNGSTIGEAWLVGAKVTNGENYLLSFWHRTRLKPGAVNTPYLGAFYANMVYSNTASYPPAMPAQMQTIFADSMVPHHPDTFYQAVSCFTASQSFEEIWFYPYQELGLDQVDLATTQVELIPLEFSLGADLSVSSGTSVTLGSNNLCSVFGAEWQWREVGNTTIIGTGNTLTVSPTANTEYVLTRAFPEADKQMDYMNGGSSCAYSDTILVIVEGNSITDPQALGGLNFPGLFSPDGDGRNDRFGIRGAVEGAIRDRFELMVYDLQGKQVFATTNPETEWDGQIMGRPASTGLYVYTVSFRNRLGEMKAANGKVLLMR